MIRVNLIKYKNLLTIKLLKVYVDMTKAWSGSIKGFHGHLNILAGFIDCKSVQWNTLTRYIDSTWQIPCQYWLPGCFQVGGYQDRELVGSTAKMCNRHIKLYIYQWPAWFDGGLIILLYTLFCTYS